MPSTSATSPHVQAVFLCAAWCGVCREFAPAVAELARQHPDASVHWVDVEDSADLVDELDVNNFPTLLIGVDGQPVFFGTILPHAQTAARLIQDAAALPPLAQPPSTAAALRTLLAALPAPQLR